MKRFDYSSVVGHELICAKLKQAVVTQKTVNAYLFSGSEGIGKKTTSLPFAAALLCEHPKDGKPCLSCPSCKLLAADSHPDFIVLQASADKKSIGVEIVREKLIKEAYIRPFSSTKKVFLIENGELLTTEAQNALLKVLEEPPEYVVFLILTTEKNQLLETVRSRCFKLQFLPLCEKLCNAYFQNISGYDESRKALAANFAQGMIGQGRKMLLDDSFYELYQNTITNITQLTGPLSALTVMQQFLTENREQIENVIDFMLVFLRDALRLSLFKTTKLICTDQQTAIVTFSQKLTLGNLISMMEAVIHYRERLQKNASFILAGIELLTRMQEEIHD